MCAERDNTELLITGNRVPNDLKKTTKFLKDSERQTILFFVVPRHFVVGFTMKFSGAAVIVALASTVGAFAPQITNSAYKRAAVSKSAQVRAVGLKTRGGSEILSKHSHLMHNQLSSRRPNLNARNSIYFTCLACCSSPCFLKFSRTLRQMFHSPAAKWPTLPSGHSSPFRSWEAPRLLLLPGDVRLKLVHGHGKSHERKTKSSSCSNIRPFKEQPARAAAAAAAAAAETIKQLRQWSRGEHLDYIPTGPCSHIEACSIKHS